MMTKMGTQLYGISKSNVKSVLSKNIFTTFLPIATSIYMSDNGIEHYYLKMDNSKLVIDTQKFENLLGISNSGFSKIIWNSEAHNKQFNRSVRPPGIDMIPVLNKKELIEMEVKLTVVPTHAEEKVTEMIIRQNTQFNFVERICYYYGNLLKGKIDLEKLKKFLKNNWHLQKPFIIHALWKTKGHTSHIDEKNTLDVVVISDFAYLYMLLSSPLEKQQNKNLVKTRIGRVVDHLVNWINEFNSKKSLTYKEISQGSRDHLKITLYPVNYQPKLKEIYYNLRLNINDFKRIVPQDSIKKLSPERRLDASALFALEKQQL